MSGLSWKPSLPIKAAERSTPRERENSEQKNSKRSGLERAGRRSFRKLVFPLSMLLAILLCLTQLLPEVGAREKDESSLFDELKLFTDVLAIVQRDYVTEVNPKKLVEGAIKGLLASLDPHSGYLDPEFYKELQVQTTGEFGGLGIEITIREGMLIVVSPMAGSPADKAGVKSGDLIIKIDGDYTRDLTLVDAVRKLRGPKGSTVTIAVQRQGAKGLLEFTIMRDNIVVESVTDRSLGGGLGYMRVSQFMEKTTDAAKKALKSLAAVSPDKQINGLIIDLRNNPGGLLNQAVSFSDLFLHEGVIVYTDGRIESQKQKFFAHERGTEPDYPLVVLVNGGSASAAEIVAAALKDHGRAVVVGMQTFGKGSVQTVIPLKNGGALTLTTALYYTKSGESIQITGVKPDIQVENPPVLPEENTGRNTQLPHLREGDFPGAIGNPNGNGDKKQNEDIRTPLSIPKEDVFDPMKANIDDWQKQDPQFAKALEVLKGLTQFKGERTTSQAAELVG